MRTPTVKPRLALLAVLIALVGLYLVLRVVAQPAAEHALFRAMPAHRPLVFAHRGGAALWPENTLAAFHGAVELGVDLLEIDVHMSGDGVPVVIHDHTVDRTTNGHGPVAAFTHTELKQLDAAYYFSPPDAPGSFPLRGQGISIPSLREVFEAFPDALISVESKERSPAAATAILELVQEFNRAETTLLASFYHDVLLQFRAAGPAIATHASEPEVLGFLAAAYLFSAGLLTPGYQALVVPPRSGTIPVITRRVVAAAAGRDLFVVAWTINDPEEMRRLTEMGVDALITDRPDLALELSTASR